MKINRLAAFAGSNLLAIASAYAGPMDTAMPPTYTDRLAPVHFRQASAPAQVFGCVNLGDFKTPDTTRGAYLKLQKLADAGMDTALIVARDGDTVQYIAYRCKS